MNSTIPLSDAVIYSKKRISFDSVNLENYISTDNILQDKLGVTKSDKIPNGKGNIPAYEQNHILVSNIRPYLKKIWLANRSGACSPDVLNFEVKKGFDPNFIYYCLFRDDFFIHMMKGSKGSKMPRGDKDQILNFELPNFDLDSQEKLSLILSTIDKKIELNNKVNITLGNLSRLIFNYWFVQFDFPDENGKPYKYSGGKMIWNEILKREIPEYWECKTLSDFVSIGKDQIDPQISPDKLFRHYSIPNFDKFGSYALENGSTIKSNKFIIRTLDVLVSKLNPWFSRVVYAQNEDYQISSTEFVVWRPEDLPTKNYLYMLAKDNSFIQYCVQSSSGTSHSHKRINPEVMMDYPIAYNSKLIKQFGELINPLLTKYFKNKEQNILLSALRDWLLPMLMNGQAVIKS